MCELAKFEHSLPLNNNRIDSDPGNCRLTLTIVDLGLRNMEMASAVTPIDIRSDFLLWWKTEITATIKSALSHVMITIAPGRVVYVYRCPWLRRCLSKYITGVRQGSALGPIFFLRFECASPSECYPCRFCFLILDTTRCNRGCSRE
jgi:hypothetical protein